jgi:beta-mannosidase
MLDRGKLWHFASGEGIAAGAAGDDHDESEWLKTLLPGGVHRALIAAKQIPDPFYDQNETACAWVEEREWWYRIRFESPPEPVQTGERLRLIFNGLDTFASIWLNGELIGRQANMFRPAIFDVTDRLRAGESNLIAICFDPPLKRIAGKTLSVWGRNPERTPMRKAQFGYGWDWGPRLPTIGVWRPIELKRERRAVLAGVHFSTVDLTRNHDRALVAVRVEVESFAASGPLVARIKLTSPQDIEIVHDLVLEGSGDRLDATAYLTVDQPRLWWTHDLGDPARYKLDVTLSDVDKLDRAEREVGIRTLELDQSPDPEEKGTRFFRLVLNGVPVFARGANWIPCESFFEVIPNERYETLLEAARDANMTIVRIWGGGIYEHDHFYDTCDRLGLLVWQDFMFACAMYPEDDPEFVAEVDAEARYQVRRLRSHPSLALWCGNNENQWLHERYFWNEPKLPPYGELYYNHILPAAVADLDGRTPYWPGSPFGGNDHTSMDDGNRHNWDVWHGNLSRHFGEEPKFDQSPEGVSFLRYGDDMGRFISEFGMHAAPVLETLRRAIPADQLYHHSPAMDWHNKDDPKNKGDNLMLTVTGVPEGLDDYIAYSQIAQAEGLKFGIEHFRRRKPHCSGAIVWQLNDCWPAQSWSVLDYYGFGKAGYFYLRRVFAPVLASFKALPDGANELWISNETLLPVTDNVTIRQGVFSGELLHEERVHIQVPANTSQPVRRWRADQLPGGPNRYLTARSGSDRFPTNRHFFAPIKDLRRPVVKPTMTIVPVDNHKLHVELTASSEAYAFFVHLTIPVEGTRFSDNYFDLVPGERRVITVTNRDEELTADMVTVGSR